MSKRTCPCCGYQTLPSADEPTWLDCPVCLWTDAPADADQAGDGDLVWAQQCFVETGASSEHVIERVRVPNDQEPRDPAWSPLAAEHDRPKANLLATIRDSFGDVIPGEGLSLDEADAADSYREANQPRRHQDWTDVTDEELGQFDAFSCLDADGFRFYIPAFMTWFLRLSPSYRVSDVQWFMFTLADGRSAQFEAFGDDQLACVSAFLDFVERYHPRCFQKEVGRARERGL